MAQEEIFKEIAGYDGKYMVSTLGRVYNKRTGRYLKGGLNQNGYRRVVLYDSTTQKKYYKNIHRLVAETFIPNPEGLECINHKDENKTNNNIENLEWCTKAYNNQYGSKAREVLQYKHDGTFIKEYNSIGQAAEAMGVTAEAILAACLGKVVMSAGYMWRYKSA